MLSKSLSILAFLLFSVERLMFVFFSEEVQRKCVIAEAHSGVKFPGVALQVASGHTGSEVFGPTRLGTGHQL